MRGGERPWEVGPDGLTLTLRVTPKGGRDALEGVVRLADGRAALKARVRAAASEGEANAALVRLLAKTLALAPGRVKLIGGATARIKRVKLEGGGEELAAALEKLTAEEGP
jgi:uncharacterized protein YggU (UPF0235/DUF167 family)